VEERGAILHAVREALRPDGLARWTTGPLHTAATLQASLDRALLADVEYDEELRRLELRRVDGDSAVVDLDATVTTRGRRPDGSPTDWTIVADGPVKLRREPDGWKVVDMVVEGRSLQAAFFAADQRATVGGLDVTVLGGRTTANQLLLFVELVNRAGRAVELRAAAAGNRRASLFGWRWSPATFPAVPIEPGTARIAIAAPLARPRPEDGVRVLLDTDAGFVDVRPADVRRARTVIPIVTRFRGASWLAQIVAIGIAAGLFYDWWVAGLTLFLLGAWSLFGLLRQLRRFPLTALAPWLAGAAGTSVAGAVLVFANGGVFFLPWWSPYAREKHDVTAYVERRFAPARVLGATTVGDVPGKRCSFAVWRVHTTQGRYFVFTRPLEGIREDAPRSLARLVAAHVRHENC
jgi:hypothetical protein